MWRELLRRWRVYLARKESVRELIVSSLAFLAAFAVNEYAIAFATSHASNSVTDLILSNIPTFDVDALFVYGTFVVVVISAAVLLSHPKRIPFALKALALFFVIRSGFTSLTHTGPAAPMITDWNTAITRSFFGVDNFFSGHTGMPFLGALAFWKQKSFRYFYLAMSVLFAIIVLLGHLHYSIDVFSAFFITYGIFHIALWLFPNDWKLFHSDL